MRILDHEGHEGQKGLGLLVEAAVADGSGSRQHAVARAPWSLVFLKMVPTVTLNFLRHCLS